MPNTPVPAAAIGLPETSRRTALAGAAALLATVCLPHDAKAEAVAQPEPIVALIQAYHAGMATMNASSPDMTDAENNALANVTWKPPFDELIERTPAIRSMAGVVAALEFCAYDMDNFDDNAMVARPLVNAALVYLKGAVA